MTGKYAGIIYNGEFYTRSLNDMNIRMFEMNKLAYKFYLRFYTYKRLISNVQVTLSDCLFVTQEELINDYPEFAI